MIEVPTHPCLSCPLPDCDDSSAACPLRRSLNEYRVRAKHHLPITPELHGAKRLAWQELYGIARDRTGGKAVAA